MVLANMGAISWYRVNASISVSVVYSVPAPAPQPKWPAPSNVGDMGEAESGESESACGGSSGAPVRDGDRGSVGEGTDGPRWSKMVRWSDG
jgi:hypothetical protein